MIRAGSPDANGRVASGGGPSSGPVITPSSVHAGAPSADVPSPAVRTARAAGGSARRARFDLVASSARSRRVAAADAAQELPVPTSASPPAE